MPLKALLDGQPILAPLLGDTAWADLYFQRYRLVLPCCPDRAVQMRGGAGTRRIQHFSHTPSPICAFRGETTAHLLAKVEIARACAEAADYARYRFLEWLIRHPGPHRAPHGCPPDRRAGIRAEAVWRARGWR